MKVKKILMFILATIMAFSFVLPTFVCAEDVVTTGKDNEGFKRYACKKSAYYFISYKKGSEPANPMDADGDLLVYYYDGAGNKVRVAIVPDSQKRDTKKVRYECYLAENTIYYYDKHASKPEEVPESAFPTFEEMLSDFVFSLANGIHLLLAWGLGKSVTIDDLVFNKYDDTDISYFTNPEATTGLQSSLIFGYAGKGGKTKGLQEVISQWYGLFVKIAISGFMVMLLYMGVRTVLGSTADEKARFKEFFVHWVTGVAILVLFPYVMRYCIVINNAMVKTIYNNRETSDELTTSLVVPDITKEVNKMSMDDEINWNGNDYMSKIASVAKQSKRLILSVTFLILTWQLVALIVAYYKRLFTVAFLIDIFPLVALSYALDKLADGRSQAFNTWVKEYMLTVFVQTFHAIVYVFVCSTVYSAAGMHTDTNGVEEMDYILIIIGTTFLFTGEKIIREIFGQISSTGLTKSLGETATGTFVALSATARLAKNAREYTVGDKSIGKKWWEYHKGQKAFQAKINAFDDFAQPPEIYHPDRRIESDALRKVESQQKQNPSLKSQKEIEKQKELLAAAAVFNNPNSHSYAEKAEALKALKDAAEEDPNQEVFKHTTLNAAQIKAMADLDKDVQRMISDGKSEEDIDKYLQVRLGYILTTFPEEQRQEMINTYMAGLYLDGATNLITRGGLRREIRDVIGEVTDVQNSFRYINNVAEIDSEHAFNMKNERDEMLDDYTPDDATEEDKQELDEVATAIAILNGRKEGITHIEAQQAIEKLQAVKKGGTQRLKDMVASELNGDLDVMAHVVARQIQSTTGERLRSEVGTGDLDAAAYTAHAKRWATATVKEYEENPLEGYYADEVSIHEVIAGMTENTVREIKGQVMFRDTTSMLSPDDLSEKVAERTTMVADLRDKYKIYGEEDEIEQFADTLATLKQMNDGVHDEKVLLEAAKKLREQVEGSKDLAEIVEFELGHNAQTVSAAIAEKILDSEAFHLDENGEKDFDNTLVNTTLDERTAAQVLSDAQNEMNRRDMAKIYDGVEDVVERLYAVRTGVMRDATSNIAENYLVDHNIDLFEMQQDFSEKTIDGYTKAELEAMQIHEKNKFFNSLVPFHKEVTDYDGGYGMSIPGLFTGGQELKARLRREEEERTGMPVSWEDQEMYDDPSTNVMQVINERKRQRMIRNNAHYYNDIQNWRKKLRERELGDKKK